MEAKGRWRGALLRWGRVWLLAALLLPVAISAGLGLLWLHERGWLLLFLGASVGFYALFRLGLALAGRGQGPDLPASAPPADWTAPERVALDDARRAIAERLKTPRPWDEMPAEAMRVVEGVAAALSGGKRGALDFTLPEGLLLIDRVALRSRAALRANLPFSDRLSLGAMVWAWRRQGQIGAAWSAGYLVWRGVRLVVHPAAGILREVERVLTRPLQEGLNDALLADFQRLLLEEAARAAVELYSGRLKFSDAELLDQARLDQGANPAPPTPAPGPLRVVVLGQTGAGKSTLINALTGENSAETGLLPTTARAEGHGLMLDGVECLLVDTPGIDGTPARQKMLVELAAGADMVIWLLRANRPARGPDAALSAALAKRGADDPLLVPPPVLRVFSAADLVLPGWPFAEHRLPAEAGHALGRALSVLDGDMGGPAALPLALSDSGTWNLEALKEALIAALPAAQAARLSRLRRQRPGGMAQTRATLAQGARGVRALARRWWP